MSNFINFAGKLISVADSFLWGPVLLTLLLGTHVFYTFRLLGIQRYIGTAFRLVIKRDRSLNGNVSPFAALAVALASTIGTGNVVGVATAIALGGPGAVFWCMMTGIFGMATKYAESLLAVKYRQVDEQGEVHGGPMYTIQNGLHCRWLAIAFSVAAAIAVIGTGDLVQSNAIAVIVKDTFGVPNWLCGLLLAVMIGLVIIGGLQNIARFCTAMVPLMAFVYLAGSLVLLYINRAFLDDTVLLIVKSAFSRQAAAGGIAGYGIMLAARYGIARGLFSNEAGMGSEPIVAATAKTRNAVRQGLVSYTGTFCTIIICALTGLIIVSSALANRQTAFSNNTLLTHEAFMRIPYVGNYLLCFVILAFASTTIIGWFYYGEQCVSFLCQKKPFVMGYKILFVLMVFFGSIGSLSIVWDFADLANGFMVLPNIISLICLNKVVVAETKKYLWSGHLDELDTSCALDGHHF